MSNAYQIRLELLKMAQSALEQEWHSRVDLVRTDWQNQISNGQNIPRPELPAMFTMDDIVAKAAILNEFVSKN